jgi:hypothetical protein
MYNKSFKTSNKYFYIPKPNLATIYPCPKSRQLLQAISNRKIPILQHIALNILSTKAQANH